MADGIPVTGVSELVLEARDLAASERFYHDILGLPVVERWTLEDDGREAVWVMAGERTRIGLWPPQIGLAGGRGGVHVHYAMHLAEDAYDGAVETRARACRAARGRGRPAGRAADRERGRFRLRVVRHREGHRGGAAPRCSPGRPRTRGLLR